MTWNDYPKAARNNAKRALKFQQENQTSCGTPVGWRRARQLASGEKISRETIARMASFKRHQKNKDVPYSEGCGGLMWDAWGGTSGIEWASRKLKQIDAELSYKMHGNKKLQFRAGSVNADTGELLDISLIQVGDALGHGMRVDSKSLESALDVLGDTLPAYITHENAFADRILAEIGFFKDFHIEENKLKARSFKALNSFKEDEAEKYRRLFDIAENIPTNFGISLVFSARVVWVLADGSEIAFEDQSTPPEGTVADLPAIRFTEINSADFVDQPAANADGLFTQKPQKNIMSEIEKLETEETEIEAQEETQEVAEEIQVQASAEVEEKVEEKAEEQAEEVQDEALDLLASFETRLNELTEQLASLATTFAQFSTEKKAADEALASYVEGTTPQAQSEEAPTESVVEQFKNAQGKDFLNIWRKNKREIISNI